MYKIKSVVIGVALNEPFEHAFVTRQKTKKYINVLRVESPMNRERCAKSALCRDTQHTYRADQITVNLTFSLRNLARLTAGGWQP